MSRRWDAATLLDRVGNLTPAQRDTRADRTCDLCGHVCPDEEGRRILAARLTLGPLLYTAGLCPECAEGDRT